MVVWCTDQPIAKVLSPTSTCYSSWYSSSPNLPPQQALVGVKQQYFIMLLDSVGQEFRHGTHYKAACLCFKMSGPSPENMYTADYDSSGRGCNNQANLYSHIYHWTWMIRSMDSFEMVDYIAYMWPPRVAWASSQHSGLNFVRLLMKWFRTVRGNFPVTKGKAIQFFLIALEII